MRDSHPHPETARSADDIMEVLSVAVERAAVAAHAWVGKGDGHAADAAATAAMRDVFSNAPFGVHVVIGEGERDAAPMLARGERLGRAQAGAQLGQPTQLTQLTQLPNGSGVLSDLVLDCAVDPLDGTSLLKNGLPGAITVAVLADAGGIVGAPDFYMEKLSCPAAARGHVHLSQTPTERVHALSRSLAKPVSQLQIAVQDRPRHHRLVAELQAAGASVRLFREGDVTIGLQAAQGDAEIDALMGIGAAPEGVITAAAIRCLGGHFQGRFVYDPEEVQSGLIGSCVQSNRERLRLAGIADPDVCFDRDELVSAKNIFVALCGITGGSYIAGIDAPSASSVVTTACTMRSDRLGQSFRTTHHSVP
jgi:fructose-1,6-bisphosphatase II / sedoheptulose-1,7-bisphosphatase